MDETTLYQLAIDLLQAMIRTHVAGPAWEGDESAILGALHTLSHVAEEVEEHHSDNKIEFSAAGPVDAKGKMIKITTTIEVYEA